MKKNISFTLSVIFLCSLLLPYKAEAANYGPPITAPSAMLLDYHSNQILFSKTPHQRRAPASTTKLLTAIVALNLAGANRTITVPAYATRMEPSKIHLRRGERYRLSDLIHALLMNSANDAAAAIAISTTGSIEKFAAQMNATARALGCRQSHFVNPHGLPHAAQYSTVYDMTLIMREAQRYPLIERALKSKTATIRSANGRRIYLRNHNKMLWRDHREVLGKTGWTRAAKHCFVGEMNLYGRKIFVAMLGSHRLWRDLKALVDFQTRALSGLRRQFVQAKAQRNKEIQAVLKKTGYYFGPVDGKIGPKTIKAIKTFQKKNGLRVDGSVGPQTWSVLQRSL